MELLVKKTNPQDKGTIDTSALLENYVSKAELMKHVNSLQEQIVHEQLRIDALEKIIEKLKLKYELPG